MSAKVASATGSCCGTLTSAPTYSHVDTDWNWVGGGPAAHHTRLHDSGGVRWPARHTFSWAYAPNRCKEPGDNLNLLASYASV